MYDLTETHGIKTVESDAADQWAQLAHFAALVAARERERIAEMAQRTVWAGREFADRIRALNTEGEGNDR